MQLELHHKVYSVSLDPINFKCEGQFFAWWEKEGLVGQGEVVGDGGKLTLQHR